MTKEQNAIPAKVGLAGARPAARQREPGLQKMGYSRDSFYRFRDRQCATSHLQKGGPFTPWLAGLCDEYDGRLKNGGGHGPERTRRINRTDPR